MLIWIFYITAFPTYNTQLIQIPFLSFPFHFQSNSNSFSVSVSYHLYFSDFRRRGFDLNNSKLRDHPLPILFCILIFSTPIPNYSPIYFQTHTKMSSHIYTKLFKVHTDTEVRRSKQKAEETHSGFFSALLSLFLLSSFCSSVSSSASEPESDSDSVVGLHKVTYSTTLAIPERVSAAHKKSMAT